MIENKFKHKLESQKIVVRQDKGSDEKDVSEIGSMFPLIRIGDTTFEKDDIKAFVLNVGESLIPTVTLTIDDADINLRGFQLTDDFIRGDSLMTIYISILQDDTNSAIKNDYKITSQRSSAGSDSVTFSAELYVPKMTGKIQYGLNTNSFDALKEIAEFCGLGFATNITDTPSDDSLWLTNKNLESLIMDIERRGSIDNDCYNIFIDAYANLTVLQYGKAIADTTQYYIETNAVGKKVEKFKLLVTNEQEIEEDDGIPLESWSSKSNLDSYLRNYKTGIYTDNTSDSSTDISIDEEEVESSMGVDGQHTVDNGRFDRDNLHASFGYIAAKNKQIKNALIQGTEIDFRLDRYTPYLFVGMNADFKMVHNIKDSKLRNQDDENSSDDALEDFEPKSGIVELEISGKYHIVDLQYVYKRSNGSSPIPMYIKGTGLKQ